MADRFGHGFAWAPDYDFYWGRRFPLVGMGSAKMARGVRVVKPRDLEVLRQIIPPNVMSIGVPGNPFLTLGDSRLGISGEEIEVQNDALKDYSTNLSLAESLISQLEQIRPADWEETIVSAQETQQAGLDFYTNLVHGKTGNQEAEQKLRWVWVSVGQKMVDLLEQRPSLLEMMADQILVFLEDWASGMREVWEGYVGWAMENAGPTLKSYHTAASRLIDLDNDLLEAQMSGKFTAQEIADQSAKVGEARAAVERARTVFAAIGGGSLDDLARQNYGKYPAALAQLQIPVAAAIAIAICAAIIVIALATVMAVGFIYVAKPVAEGVGQNVLPLALIAGATILGAYVLPAVLSKPDERTRVKPSAATA